jgi:low affinity Fe/Cu permease
VHSLFHRFAQHTSAAVGSPWAFAAAVTTIALWGVAGPVLGFSTTWQLVINTATTIVTFLIVFLIQNTQNRESQAIQLKLDALILASAASDQALDLENISDEQAADMLKRFHTLASRASNGSRSPKVTRH